MNYFTIIRFVILLASVHSFVGFSQEEEDAPQFIIQNSSTGTEIAIPQGRFIKIWTTDGKITAGKFSISDENLLVFPNKTINPSDITKVVAPSRDDRIISCILAGIAVAGVTAVWISASFSSASDATEWATIFTLGTVPILMISADNYFLGRKRSLKRGWEFSVR